MLGTLAKTTGHRSVYAFAFLAFALFLPRALDAQGVTAIIDFENSDQGEILSTVDGDASGTPVGPVGLYGEIMSDLGTNRALIFDSANPTGGDWDLGSPNQDFGGPGIGPGGENGAPYPNTFPLGKILILAEDLVDNSPADGLIDDPDDAAEQDMILEFDFTTINSPFVPTDITVYEITTIDGENSEAPGTARLYDASDNLIATVPLFASGCNGVRMHAIGSGGNGISGVARMEIELDGSGGIDGIVFEATPPVTDPICSMTPMGTPVPGGEEYTIEVGQTLTIDIDAEATTYGSTIILSSMGLPSGATMNPPLPIDSSPGTTASSTFTWTPTAADIGTHAFWFKVDDSFGAQSVCDPIIIVTCSAAIDTHPEDVTVCETDSASFSVTASGSPPFSYQWRKDGTNIPGATSAIFTLPSTNASDAGSYDVVVTNACETLTSNPATLTVQTDPTVSDPVGDTICEGDDFSFVVSVTGSPTPTIQWRKDGSPIAGANSATLTITGATTADAGNYDVVVTNNCGTETSRAAALIVNTGPVIASVGVSNAAPCATTSITFTSSVSGSAPLTLQWRKNGVAIPGATGSSFTIASVSPGDAGSYDLVASNDCDTATSSAIPLTVKVAPTVDSNPSDATVCEGDSVSFSASASGTAPLSYQWRFNGTPIAGATAATFSIASATTGDAGSYDVIVTNECGSATSSPAALTVRVAPTVDSQPMGATVCEGDSVTFSASASGSAPLSYQWTKNGSNIPGATSASYTIPSPVEGDSGTYAVTVTNDCGSDTSNGAVLTVRVAPAITAQPMDATACEGESITLSASASGSAPLTYQWFQNGSAIPGANGASYTIASAAPGNAGNYTVTVSNDCGDATSDAAVVTVNSPPTLTSQPMSSTNCEGDSVSFSVTANGTAPLSYQWFLDGAPIPGATAATYSIASATEADSGTYTATVSNLCGDATSDGAVLTVQVAPSITAQPQSQMVCEGDSASFSVTADGTAPLSYQWFRDGVAIPGANGASYSIASATTVDAGSYTVDVSNSCGTASSSAAVLTVDTAPSITSQPMSMTACEGDSVSFSVSATGTAPLSYQWFLDGSAIPGASGATYTIAAVGAGDTGTYSVTVSNLCGDATSTGAVLTVEVAPSITAQPQSQTVCEGDAATFSVSADGTAPLGYQWFRDGVAIPGATSASYSIASTATGDAGSYTVDVTNNCGTASSMAAILTVETAPVITADPTSMTACEGDLVSFLVAATGTAPLSYQWFLDGVAIPGATGAVYEITSANPADAGVYTVTVSNSCGDATSAGATLTVEIGASISAQPQSQMVCEGDSASFTVEATGTAPISYQWFLDGAAIPGATSATYSIASSSAADSGNYTVEVSNACASETSAVATLTVDTAPAITAEPMSTTACEGESVTFSVSATGSTPLSYQWFQDGTSIPGATSASFTIAAATPGNAGNYTVTVTNICGTATSAGATLTVQLAPSITAQPMGADACVGDAITLTVTADGTTPLSYQWAKDGSAIPGATSDTLTIASASASDAGSYTVTVTNSCGSVTSDPAVVNVDTAPAITVGPQSDVVCEGDTVTFVVSATGTAPLAYQWLFDGAPIGGATDSTFTIAAASAGDVGSYTVEVTNNCGTATSSAATLDVLTPPSVTDPADVTVCEGDPVLLSVTASGSAPLSIQWRKDGVNIPGATMDTFEIPSPVAADAGAYDAVVTNDCGTATSAAANVVVNTAPMILVHPSGGMFAIGDSVTLTVTVDGTGPFDYQWRFEGTPIPGATGDSYTITDLQEADSGMYDVTITNLCGSVISQVATVVVMDEPPIGFIRGDCNVDGIVNLADAVKIMRFTFQGFPPSECMEACDHNDDGTVDIADVIFLLQYIFLEGASPGAPFTVCGPDPTAGSVGCDNFDACPTD